MGVEVEGGGRALVAARCSSDRNRGFSAQPQTSGQRRIGDYLDGARTVLQHNEGGGLGLAYPADPTLKHRRLRLVAFQVGDHHAWHFWPHLCRKERGRRLSYLRPLL